MTQTPLPAGSENWPAALVQVLTSTLATAGNPAVLGFYDRIAEQSDNEVSEVWTVTREWMTRIESSQQAALVVTIPTSGIRRLAELYTAEGLSVTIEIDGEGYTQLLSDTGPAKFIRTTYTLTASEQTQVAKLQRFAGVIKQQLGNQ